MITVITGFRAELVRLRILTYLLLLALKKVRNPVKAISVISDVRKKRKEVHASSKITKFIRSGRRYFFMDNIPGWPSKAASGYFKGETARALDKGGKKAPFTTVFLSVTSKCPLRCHHCYEKENLAGSELLSLDDLRHIISKLRQYGVHHFQLSGGEPLERFDDLVTLVRELSAEADVWINTSGFGLTAERAIILKNAGLTGAEISLDHWSEERHNLFRGNNKSFYWAREAAKNCCHSGILTCLSLCATDTFVTEENLTKYVTQAMEWGISFIRLLEPRKTKYYDNEKEMLSPEKTKILEDFFIKSHKGHNPSRYPVVSYPSYHQRRTGCLGAGDHYLYIDPRGDVHACPFCRLPAGNALTDSIEDIVMVLKKRGCHVFVSHTSDKMIT